MPAAGDAFGQQTKWRRAREGGGRRTDRGSPTWNATRPRGSEGRRQGGRGGRRDGTKGEGCSAVASAGGADRDAAARRRTRAGGRGDGIPFTVRAWVLWIVGSGGCGHDWIGWTDDYLRLGHAAAQLVKPSYHPFVEPNREIWFASCSWSSSSIPLVHRLPAPSMIHPSDREGAREHVLAMVLRIIVEFHRVILLIHLLQFLPQ